MTVFSKINQPTTEFLISQSPDAGKDLDQVGGDRSRMLRASFTINQFAIHVWALILQVLIVRAATVLCHCALESSMPDGANGSELIRNFGPVLTDRSYHFACFGTM